MSKRKRLVLGLLLSSVISLLAYRRRSLTKSGVAGAIITGTTTFLQYSTTDRGNKENQTSSPASPDAGNSNRTIANISSGFVLGELAWGLSLIYFFVSSSLFSHYRERDKAQTATDKFSK